MRRGHCLWTALAKPQPGDAWNVFAAHGNAATGKRALAATLLPSTHPNHTCNDPADPNNPLQSQQGPRMALSAPDASDASGTEL